MGVIYEGEIGTRRIQTLVYFRVGSKHVPHVINKRLSIQQQYQRGEGRNLQISLENDMTIPDRG